MHEKWSACGVRGPGRPAAAFGPASGRGAVLAAVVWGLVGSFLLAGPPRAVASDRDAPWHIGCATHVAGKEFRPGKQTRGLEVSGRKGQTSISWETEAVTVEANATDVSFVWRVSLGTSRGCRKFRLLVSPSRELEFMSRLMSQWVVQDSGVTLSFVATELSARNDLMGLMKLTVPLTCVTPGKPLRLTIEAEPASGWRLPWVVVFSQPDAMEDLGPGQEPTPVVKAIALEGKLPWVRVVADPRVIGESVTFSKGAEPFESARMEAWHGWGLCDILLPCSAVGANLAEVTVNVGTCAPSTLSLGEPGEHGVLELSIEAKAEGPNAIAVTPWLADSARVMPQAELIVTARSSDLRVVGRIETHVGKETRFDLQPDVYRITAESENLKGHALVGTQAYVAAEDLPALARALVGRARQAATKEGNSPYAGWLDHLAVKTERKLAAGELEPEDAPLLLDLGEWPARVDQDPNAMASLRGQIEWAYRSSADGCSHPFVLGIPDAYDPEKAWPLEVDLHGFGGSHLSYGRPGAPHPHGYFKLCIHGRARGVEYMGLSEQDVLEAMDFVVAHWSIDPDRVHLAGHSMGGFGAIHVAARNPDRFASVRAYSASGLHRPMENLVNLPVFALHGAADRVVPPGMISGPVHQIASFGGVALLHVYEAWGHGIRNHSGAMDFARQWALPLRRNKAVRRILFSAYDRHSSGAYWAKVVEWGAEGGPARIDAQLGANNVLYLHADNVATLALDLETAPVDRERPLQIAADHVVVGEISPPFPETVYISPGRPEDVAKAADGRLLPGGWTVSDQAPTTGVERLHFPGGSFALFHGEPLMVVWGTAGTQEASEKLYELGQVIRRSADGKWPHAETQRDGWPVFHMNYGQHAGKADTDVTQKDMQRYNLILLGDASQNTLVDRMSGELPVAITGGRIVANDGFDWAYRDRGLGLHYYNPLSPGRLVYWVAADRLDFFRLGKVYPGATMMDYQGMTEGPADFMVMDTGQTRLVAARRLGSRWNWLPDYGESPVLETPVHVNGPASKTVALAACRAAGADFGMTQGTDWYSFAFDTLEDVTRRADVIACWYGERVGTMELSGAEIKAAEASMLAQSKTIPKSDVDWTGVCYFFPRPALGRIEANKAYKVAFPAGAMFTFSKYADVSTESFRMTDIHVRDALATHWE